MVTGGCHCRAVRFSVSGESTHSSVCHCESCRRTTGGLMTAWVGFESKHLSVEGETRAYASSPGVERHFCPQCGTSLFYFYEEAMPGKVDIPTATFDDPALYPPSKHVQLADAIEWEGRLAELPTYPRFPGV